MTAEFRNGGNIDPDLVSVIVPCFNGAATIAETLDSVLAQSYPHLEIIVVDDGSSDRSADIVADYERRDRRVRLIRQPNAGVAVARNTAIAASQGGLIAPVDADDLWAPDKLERQIAVLRTGGENAGLVYCWYAIIDENSRIRHLTASSTAEGRVLPDLMRFNFTGNGSSALMRRDAVIAGGCYDPGLKAMDAQGCEDYKLYLAIADNYTFAVVPDYLVGYRTTARNMSSDGMKMLKSYELVLDPYLRRFPSLRGKTDYGTVRYYVWNMKNNLKMRRIGNAFRILKKCMLLHPGALLFFAAERTVNRVGRMFSATRPSGGGRQPDKNRKGNFVIGQNYLACAAARPAVGEPRGNILEQRTA